MYYKPTFKSCLIDLIILNVINFYDTIKSIINFRCGEWHINQKKKLKIFV